MPRRAKDHALLFLKPDALIHSLSGAIMTRISNAFNSLPTGNRHRVGIIYAAQKVVAPTEELLREHYAHLREKPFFQSTVDYILGKHHYTREWAEKRGLLPEDVTRYRRLLVYAVAGTGIVKVIRGVLGPTDPDEAKRIAENTIRAQHGERRPILDPHDSSRITDYLFYNVAHASAEGDEDRELRLWFTPADFSDDYYRESLGFAIAQRHYYLTPDNLVTDRYTPRAMCIAAPSDMVWTSDLEILDAHLEHGPRATTLLSSAVAKYRLNMPTSRPSHRQETALDRLRNMIATLLGRNQ